MSQVIKIPSELYRRLESHTVGFDTPANVIERILDAYEGVSPTDRIVKDDDLKTATNKLEIIYVPATEEAFKEQFVKTKKAFLKIFYTNGETEVKAWDSPNFTDTSSVSGNLRSGYLRNWKDKGIFKAEISINND
jgi:hypothetical protein